MNNLRSLAIRKQCPKPPVNSPSSVVQLYTTELLPNSQEPSQIIKLSEGRHSNKTRTSTVTLEQVSDWYNQSQIPPIRQTETNFVEFCEQAYRKILEVANSTDSSGVSAIFESPNCIAVA
ncbi:hypothetical protein AHF37_00817 [Paragonimus kellicotti]|nr:hypothetical protein AHF37_00817 [Paragonimus kellicotti]